MATAEDKLSRLQIASPCRESWDAMQGGDVYRHCAQCDRQVFDFRRMTARDIEALVEASGGRLCARISRGADGRVLTLEPQLPPVVPSTWTPQRVSAVTAAVVSAFLGLSPASAGPLPLDPPAGTAGSIETSPAVVGAPKVGENRVPEAARRKAEISGEVTDETRAPIPGVTIRARNIKDGRVLWAVTDEKGRFTFPAVDAGRYDLEASIEGFEVETRQALKLRPGRARQVNFVIRPSDQEVITITGEVCFLPEPSALGEA